MGKELTPFEQMSREELLEYLRAVQEEEGIGLLFRGKEVASRIYRKVQPRSSRRVPALCVGTEEEQAKNLVLEGENLQAMVTLYKERGAVDLILTDPPYNTGGDFRYNDRWDEDPNDPDLGTLVEEDSPGRHTKWMKFMLPRLKVMRSMLKPGGVLAICIDHRELFRLGQMLDEVFLEKNRLGIINWQKSYSPRNDNKHLSTATEYLLVYAKEVDNARTGLLERTAKANSRYKNPDDDENGLWREHDLSARTPDAKNQYAIQSPFTGTLYYPTGTRSWAHPKKNVKAWLEEWGVSYEERDIRDGRAKALLARGGKVGNAWDGGRERPGTVPKLARDAATAVLGRGQWPFVWFGLKGEGGPRVKKYLERVRKGIVPMTYWADEDYDEPIDIGTTSWDDHVSGKSQTGIKELKAIVGGNQPFETVKPLQLFMKIVQLWCPPGGLVVDPFAGSGTTGHAVLALNAAIGSDRRFILIEQGRPEKGDSYARTLLAERLRRVIVGDWANGKGEPLGGGFRFNQLQKKVDAKAVLGMERDEMTDTLIASHFDANRRGGPGLILMTHEGYEYLVARNTDGEGFFLVWNGAPEPPVFAEDVYDAVVTEAAKAGLKPVYHVYARFNLYQSDDVRFYQIPDRILLDFGLQLNDIFNNDSEELLR